jgi:RNA 2',3'-cyclic 3'-phosphodiesterase
MSFPSLLVADQLSLFEIPEAPGPEDPTDNLFLAIVPDPDAAAVIARLALHLRVHHGLVGRPLAANRFHVSLHHLGTFAGVPPGLLTLADKAVAEIAAATHSFTIAFDRALSFSGKPGNHAFVLRMSTPNAALQQFRQDLGSACGRFGFPRARSQFVPHVTLLYDARNVPEHAIEPISWNVTEFTLVRSLVGQSRHIPLARWSLTG